MEIPDNSAYRATYTHAYFSAYQLIDVRFCLPKTRANLSANNASLIAHRPHKNLAACLRVVSLLQGRASR
jgi:hypothetical protein